MAYTFGTFIVTNAVRANLHDLSQRLDRANTDGMFTTGLSATGIAPATHWISTGMVPAAYLNVMGDPVRLYNVAKKAYEDDGDVFPFTQAQVTNALSKCDVSADPPFDAMTRMGLQLVAA